MLIEKAPIGTRPGFSRRELGRARHGENGVFAEGRAAELDALGAMGARDASLGRLYEGHFNGVHLVALYGDADQRERASRDVEAGHLFGVWNAQDADGLRIARIGTGFELSGSKTWASGAGSVTRALVTARRADGTNQMCLVRFDETAAAIDASAWKPHGMHGSDSYRVCFDGVRLRAADLIGAPDDYERQPWFLGGALRFAAVHSGIVSRLTDAVLSYLATRNRAGEPLQQARAGEMRIAAQSAANWIRAGREAWIAFDEGPTSDNAAAVVDIVDMARLGVERAALDVIERAVRGVGANGLLEPLPFVQLVRDLEMYLRQPAPDATLLRVGSSGLHSASARRSDAIAD